MLLLNLGVVSASGLLPRGPRQTPNCCVNILADGKLHKTELRKRTLTPFWNQTITMSIPSVESPLNIQLLHDSSFPLTDYLLGEITITAQDALKQGQDGGQFCLELSRASKGSTNTLKSGQLFLTAALTDCSVTAAGALVSAKQAVVASDLRAATAESIDQLCFMPATGIVSNGTNLLRGLLMRLDAFISIVDEASKVHPIACLAWNIVSAVLKAIKGQLDRDARIAELLSVMNNVYSFIDTIKSMADLTPVLESNADLVLKQTVECALFIQEYCGSGFSGRALNQTFDVTVDKKIGSFIETFKVLHTSISTGVSMQAALVSYRVLDHVDLLVREQSLRKLNPVELDTSDRIFCLPNTRIPLLQDITGWAMTATPTLQNIFWLHGLAGSGKSTVATTLAGFFRDLRRLGAFVFFNRDEPERSSPSRVIKTIAAQLSAFDPRIGQAVAHVVETVPGVCEAPLSTQFTELIVKPLTSIEALASEGPIVVILEALDESGSAATRERLLAVLAEQSAQLPPFLRIIITSRTELDIMDAFEPCSNVHSQELDILATTNNSDIAAYFHDRFRTIRGKRKNRALALPPDWPGEEVVQSLVQRSAGLFVWASTACAFIDAHDPRARLHTLMHGNSTSIANSYLALDMLYSTALAAAGDWGDPDFVASFQEIIGTVVVSMEPLTTEVVDGLLGLPANAPSIHTVERLGCVLSWGSDRPIRTLHPSFIDFLTTPGRCKRPEWFIDTALHRRRVALRCLDHMESYFMRDPRDGADEVPASVAYACAFFISHVLSVTEGSAEVAARLIGFLTGHVSQWSRTMHALNKSYSPVNLLTQLLEWTQKNALLASDPVFGKLESVVQDAIWIMTSDAGVQYPCFGHATLIDLAEERSVDDVVLHGGLSVGTEWPSILQVLSTHLPATSVHDPVEPPTSTISFSSCDHTATGDGEDTTKHPAHPGSLAAGSVLPAVPPDRLSVALSPAEDTHTLDSMVTFEPATTLSALPNVELGERHSDPKERTPAVLQPGNLVSSTESDVSLKDHEHQPGLGVGDDKKPHAIPGLPSARIPTSNATLLAPSSGLSTFPFDYPDPIHTDLFRSKHIYSQDILSTSFTTVLGIPSFASTAADNPKMKFSGGLGVVQLGTLDGLLVKDKLAPDIRVDEGWHAYAAGFSIKMVDTSSVGWNGPFNVKGRMVGTGDEFGGGSLDVSRRFSFYGSVGSG